MQHIIPIQGKAQDSSSNLLELGNVSVRIYTASTGGNLIYSNSFLNSINTGIYDIQLSVDLNNTKEYYLELDINGEEVVGDATSGRQVFYPGGGDHTHTHAGLFIPTVNTVDNSSKITYNSGNVGLGVTEPMERLHIGDGHVLIEGGGETQLIFKRDFKLTQGPSGNSTNPMFKLGRIIEAGDGDPEFRALYSDDEMAALGNYDGRTVFEFDRKGIVASVQPFLGSHFEGFLYNDSEPHFRLNSWPSMQLEMGTGGKNSTTNKTDVAIRRSGKNRLSFITGATDDTAIERLIIDGNGNVGIGREAGAVYKLDVNGSTRLTSLLANNLTVTNSITANTFISSLGFYRSLSNVMYFDISTMGADMTLSTRGLGIGTSVIDDRLEVDGAIDSTGGYEVDNVTIIDNTGDLKMNNIEPDDFDGELKGSFVIGASFGYDCNTVCASHGLSCGSVYFVGSTTYVNCTNTGNPRHCWCE